MYVLQSFKKQHECMGTVILGEQENKSLIVANIIRFYGLRGGIIVVCISYLYCVI
ncbi:hypothetical protein HanPSC8_Chr03g0089061 [Helianthus annuus]|nr:hypothetical protein HanPSC8_Chr03g0089061 [Helianthus annuus]